MKTETISDGTSVSNGRPNTESDTNEEKVPPDGPHANVGRSSELMLGLLDEFTKIYKDKLERLENSSMKMEEKSYLQAKVSLLERWLGELGEQNAVLVGAVGELEREAASRVSLLQKSLGSVGTASVNSADALVGHRRQLVEAVEGRAAAEERLLQVREENRRVAATCDALRSDLTTLLRVVSRGRSEGSWRCDDVTFLCISPDQVNEVILPASGRTTPSCGLKGSLSPSDPHCTDPFPLIGRLSEAQSSPSLVQGQVGADQAEMQLSVNIDALVARLAEAERECEQSRSEVCQLRAECETLRERASEAELSHECCDAAVARLHRELQESLKISRELQQQISSREASPAPPTLPANILDNSAPADAPSGDATAGRSTSDASVMAGASPCASEASSWDARLRLCRLENEVSEKGILVRELQGHLATARHECCLKDVTIKKVEDKLQAVRADLCEREERRKYLEQQLGLLQRQLAHTHAQAQQLSREVDQKGQLVQKLERESWSLAGQLNARAAGADTLQLTADHVAQELIVRNSEITQQRLTIASLQDALVASKQTCDVLRAQLDEDVSHHVDPARPVPRPHVLTTNTHRGTHVADNARLSADDVNFVGDSLPGPVLSTSDQAKEHGEGTVGNGSGAVKFASVTGPGSDANDFSGNEGQLTSPASEISTANLTQQNSSSMPVNETGLDHIDRMSYPRPLSPVVRLPSNEFLSFAETQSDKLNESPAIASTTIDPFVGPLRRSVSSPDTIAMTSSDPCIIFANQVPLTFEVTVSEKSSSLYPDSNTKCNAEPSITQVNILSLDGGAGKSALHYTSTSSTDCSHIKNSSPCSVNASVKCKGPKENYDDLKLDIPITTQPQPLTVPTTVYESSDREFEKPTAALAACSVLPTDELKIEPKSLNKSSVEYVNSIVPSSDNVVLETNVASDQLQRVVNKSSTNNCKESIVTSMCDGNISTCNDSKLKYLIPSHADQGNQNTRHASIPMFQLRPLEPAGIINNNVFPFFTPSMDFPAITPIYSNTLDSDSGLQRSVNDSRKENEVSNRKVSSKHSVNYPVVNLDDLQRCALPDYLSPDSVLNLSRVQSYHHMPGAGLTPGLVPSRPGLACDYSLSGPHMFSSQCVMPANGASFSANNHSYSASGVVSSDAFHSSSWSSSGFQRPGFFKRPKDYVIPCRKPDAKQGEILDV